MPVCRLLFFVLFLGAVLVFGAGAGDGLYVVPVQAAERHDADGWAYMPSGTKMVFPGIHGGTAPVSLEPLEDGRLLARNGETGQDFIHLIKKKDKSTVNEVDRAAAIAAAREVVLANGRIVMLATPPPVAAELWSAPQEPHLSVANERLQPVLVRKRTITPLKLRPYPVL